MICDLAEWGRSGVDERHHHADMTTELEGEEMVILDGPAGSIYEETAPMLDYPFLQYASNINTLAQDMFEPYLPYSPLQSRLEPTTHRPHGSDCPSQSQEHTTPLVFNDTFDASILDLGSFDKYSNITDSQQEETCQPSPSTLRKRPMRRQNHACDTCRSSKKACDLPLTVSIGSQYKVSKECTTCKIRGVECTAQWLSDKQSIKQAKKRARVSGKSPTDSRIAEDGQKTSMQIAFGIPTPTSTAELELGKSVMAQSTCSENFHLYVHSFDMPVTQCLLGGSMPLRYSLGIGAYIPLCSSPRVSAHVKLAASWVETCWPVSLSNHTDPTSMVPTPHLLSAVCVLDALFFHSAGSESSGQSVSSRDLLITDAYRWVAAATAAQFVLKNVENLNGNSANDINEVQMASLRDVACAAWCKARDMVFRCIAATKSFRLATSLVLFGLINPVLKSDEDRQACEEESRYALHEGLSRLRSLNTHARSRLQAISNMEEVQSPNHGPLGKLSSDERANVFELIGASEWMVSLMNSVIIVTSRGSTCPLPFDGDVVDVKIQGGKCLEDIQSSKSCESEIDELISSRTKNDFKSAVACQELGDEDSMIRVGREASSITIVLWQSLARFVMAVDTLEYDLISRWYMTTSSLIDVWRNLFGSVGASTRLTFRKQGYRRTFAFYSNDADVAILLFYETVQKLEARLPIQPSSPAEEQLASTLRAASIHNREQRLMSAIMISVIAASYNDTSSAEHRTCAAGPDSIGVHPLPLMMVQAHTLAAQAFADELYGMFAGPIDTKRAKEMTDGLESCLNGLGKCRRTLISSLEEDPSSVLVPGI